MVVVVVIIIPPLVASRATPVIFSAPCVQAFPLRVWSPIALDHVTERLVVHWPSDPATTLQEGQILHYLKVVAQIVDLGALEVGRCVEVWLLLVLWYGCRW
jgi:hypothetical protein